MPKTNPTAIITSPRIIEETNPISLFEGENPESGEPLAVRAIAQGNMKSMMIRNDKILGIIFPGVEFI